MESLASTTHHMVDITPGRYRHYKGNDYTVLGVARHSKTLDERVSTARSMATTASGSGRRRCSSKP
jgi:hypothetical protein